MTQHGPEMGRCPNCSTPIGREHPYQWCAECGNALPKELRPEYRAAAAAAASTPAPAGAPVVKFRRFQSSVTPWDTLFSEVAEFATKVGRGRLISIAHSEDSNDGVVTVWYWSA